MLRLAREKGNLQHEGVKFAIFPDCTIQIKETWRTFLDVKKQLRKEGLSYAMLYPARLKITIDDKRHICSTPQQVTKLLLEHIQGRGEHQGAQRSLRSPSPMDSMQ
mgnify:CR=1 FL=1